MYIIVMIIMIIIMIIMIIATVVVIIVVLIRMPVSVKYALILLVVTDAKISHSS